MDISGARAQEPKANPRGFLGWRMVALGFLAANLAIGLSFGTFGVLIKPVAEEFGASRGMASFGIAIVLLLMGIAGPALGVAFRHFRIRSVMIAGALLMAAGFAVASRANSFALFLVGYSLLGGAGCAMLGIIPASTLMANWFVARRGLALGLISVPLLVAAAPPVFASLVEAHDWRYALLMEAALLLLTLPILWLVVDRPEDVGQEPLGAERTSFAIGPDSARGVYGRLLQDRYFWGILVSAGLITTGGIVIVSHLVPFATDAGIAPTAAAMLISVNGTASMVGAMLCGWVADRIGARLTLGLIGLTMAVLWSLLLAFPRYEVIMILLVGIGPCSGGLHPAFAALLANVFGREAFAVALGLATLLMLPFTFFAAPLAGAIYDSTGSYHTAFAVEIGAFSLAAAMLLGIFAKRAR
jgi:predicted MFS family arabinose efflux permease